MNKYEVAATKKKKEGKSIDVRKRLTTHRDSKELAVETSDVPEMKSVKDSSAPVIT